LPVFHISIAVFQIYITSSLVAKAA